MIKRQRGDKSQQEAHADNKKIEDKEEKRPKI